MYPLITVNSALAKEYNLSEEHIIALVMIIKQEDPFVSTIANALFLSISKTSRIVRDLEKVGLIKRKYGECEDRRKIKLEPTQKGLKILELLYKELMEFFSQLMTEFGPDEFSTFTSLLEKFNTIAGSKIQKLFGKDAQNNPDMPTDGC